MGKLTKDKNMENTIFFGNGANSLESSILEISTVDIKRTNASLINLDLFSY